MSDNNIVTIVQSGESLGLYANMYGCTVKEIEEANNLKNQTIKSGQNLIIPIGKMPKQKTEKGVLQKKLAYFDNKLEEAHMKLYNLELSKSEREKLEKEYIDLKNLKKERDKIAEFSLAGNGINLVLTIKKEVTVSEFRKLFPECTTNFYSYAGKTNQKTFEQGKGFSADPNTVKLHAESKHMIRADEYAIDDGDGFWRSLKKTFGGRLDGK